LYICTRNIYLKRKVMISTQLNWLSVADGNLPKPKYATSKGGTKTRTVSTQLLCFDGGSVWSESYCFEEDEKFFKIRVTHYVELEKIPFPTQTKEPVNNTIQKLETSMKTGNIQTIYLEGILMPNGEIMSNGNSIGYENRYHEYLYVKEN
jgi:hypothetical protein